MDIRRQSSERELAYYAYNAYRESVGGKAFNGDDLPSFEGLNLTITTAWIAASRAVATAVRGEYL